MKSGSPREEEDAADGVLVGSSAREGNVTTTDQSTPAAPARPTNLPIVRPERSFIALLRDEVRVSLWESPLLKSLRKLMDFGQRFFGCERASFVEIQNSW